MPNRVYRVADPRSDVEVEQLGPGSCQHDVLGLDVSMTSAFSLSAISSSYSSRQLAFAPLPIELVEPRAVRVDRDECAQHVKRDIDRFPISQVLLPVAYSARSSPSMYSMMRYHSPWSVCRPRSP